MDERAHQEVTELTEQSEELWGQITNEVEAVWADIFKTANQVLRAHVHFGFENFVKYANPSIEDVLYGLRVIEAMLDTISLSNKLEYDESRLILNAKQQILTVERIAEALKNGNRADYETAMQALRQQAQF